jgi:hypothetical protein
MQHRLWMVTVIIVLFFEGLAQPVQTARFEQESKSSEEEFYVLPMERDGLLLIQNPQRFEKNEKIWELLVLDAELQTTWAARLPLPPDHILAGYEYKPGTYYLFFNRKNQESFKGIQVTMHLSARKLVAQEVDVNLNFKLTHYTVAEPNAIFGGFINKEPAIAIFDAQAGRSRILPGFFLNDTDLLDIRPNRNNTFSVLELHKKNSDKFLLYRAYDRDGALLIEDQFRLDPEVNLISAATSTLKNDEIMISGTFAYGNFKQASGIFTAMVNPFDDEPLRFTDFPQLTHFLDFMPEKRAGKIIQKATQRKVYGRASDYRIASTIHRIDDLPFGFVVFGESFLQPATGGNMPNYNPYNPYYYRTMYYPYAMFYNPYSPMRYGYDPFMQQQMMQSNYKMVNSFVVAFDLRGNRLWDQSISLNELNGAPGEQFSDYAIKNDTAHFMFPDKSKIRFSKTSGNNGRKTTDMLSIASDKNETIQEESFNGYTIRHWYNDQFIIYGHQTVREFIKPGEVDRKKVFFVNKISLSQPEQR